MKEIKNTTVIDKKAVNKFCETYYFDKFKVLRIIINILGLTTIIAFFTKNNYFDVQLDTFIIVLICLLILNSSLIPKLNTFRYFKKQKGKTNTFDYLFKSNNFKYGYKKDSYASYSDLKKVIEVKDYIYLYLSNNTVLIVSKESFNNNDLIIVTSLLKEKVIHYKYKNV